MVGQDKLKGKSVFLQALQRFPSTAVYFQTVTPSWRKPVLKSPFKIWGKEVPLILNKCKDGKGNNPPCTWKMRNPTTSLIPIQVSWCQPSFTDMVVETEGPHVTSLGSTPYLCEMPFNEGVWFLTTALQDAISFTRSITSWLNVVGQNTCDTSPLLQASCAVSFLPQNNISFACETKRFW